MQYPICVYSVIAGEDESRKDSFTTGDIVPFSEFAKAQDIINASEERHFLGSISGVTAEAIRVSIFHDDLGCVHAAVAGEDAGEAKQLNKRVGVVVGGLTLTCDLDYDAQTSSWSAVMVSKLSRGRRFLNWLFQRRCGKCAFFDRQGAQQWRMQSTHTFDDKSGTSMWDDVTKIASTQAHAPDFQPGDFGYCPKRDCGLAYNLEACESFKRRRG